MKPSPKLLEKDLVEIIGRYNIGNFISFDSKSKSFDGKVYIFKTSKGKYVLKIFSLFKLSNIKYQNAIIRHLAKHNVPVPINVLNKKGDEITNIFGEDLLIQKFVDGREDSLLSIKLVKDMGKNFGLMHQAMLKFKDYEKKFDKSEYKILKLPKGSKFESILNFDLNAINSFNDIPLTNLRKCHIHGDISCVNFLTKNDKLKAIIDFEEAHYGILVYDLATFIAQNFVRSNFLFKKKIKYFIEEYEKIIKLNEYEKKALYYLIVHRLVIVIHWYTFRMQKYNIKSRDFREGINRSINRLKRFEKITLEKFIHMIGKSKD
ncbi:MAG: phosphotransferase [Nanoarchaeota archaeon]|nr:phosphotransferase [Nanoarchaeota archaeon]